MPREFPWASKNCKLELVARSTSVKTTPNPFTAAGTAPPEPGRVNVASMMLLSSGTKSRTGLKVANAVAHVALMAERLPWTPPILGAMSTVPPAMGVWVRPLPGVVKVAPRVFWKTVNGVTAAVPLVAPPPSQLISRCPIACGPLLPLSGLPS